MRSDRNNHRINDLKIFDELLLIIIECNLKIYIVIINIYKLHETRKFRKVILVVY